MEQIYIFLKIVFMQKKNQQEHDEYISYNRHSVGSLLGIPSSDSSITV